jgi:ERCC4-type nuclease
VTARCARVIRPLVATSAMALEVDTNEHVVRGCLDASGVEHAVVPLTVGDFRFRAPDNRCLAVAERKTCSDLASSIETGRYAEQRTRLLEYRVATGCKLFYIIEGPIAGLDERKRKRVEGALENLVARHNIPVLHTTDAVHTARALRNLHKKLAEDATGDGGPGHVQALPRTRKSKVEDNMLALQLTVIPGVSLMKAQAIAERYPSMADLVRAFGSAENPESLLQDVLAGGKRLGPALSRKVCNALFSRNNDTVCTTTTTEDIGAAEDPSNIQGNPEGGERSS